MLQTFSEKIATLYEKMDLAWHSAARHYGFQCNGCEDNCCRSTFYHHTHIEKAYLLSGVYHLPREVLVDIRSTLENRIHQPMPGETKDSLPPMCPLNIDGLCVLYRQRPMICRLHGIPHELHQPGGKTLRGGGCITGSPLFEAAEYFPFDRTPFYREMAQIETEYRQASGQSGKIKETVTQMLLGALDGAPGHKPVDAGPLGPGRDGR